MKNSLLDTFKKVPSKTEVKMCFKSNNNYNIKLLNQLKSKCSQITSTYYLDKGIVSNMFDYFYENLNYKKREDAEKIVNILIDASIILDNIDEEKQSTESMQSINYIKNSISIFIIRLSDEFNMDAKDFIKKTTFNKITYDLFKRRNNKEVVPMILKNIDVLNYHDFNGKTFDDILFEEYNKAKNNKGLKDYFINLIKVLVLVPNLNINKERYYGIIKDSIFPSEYIISGESPLSKKISSLDYKEKNGRYYLTNDFTFSIDGYNTRRVDDAFSIERYDDGYILGIHIADTYSKGFTDKIIIDHEQYLSSSGYEAASLNKENIKNSSSLFIDFDLDGNIKEYQLLPTKVKVNYNIIDKDLESLFVLNKGINSLSNINITDKKKLLNSIGNLVNLYTSIDNRHLTKYPDFHNLGFLIVEKFMMLYNAIVSKHFIEKELPFIYLNGNMKVNRFSVINKGFDTGFKEDSLKSYCRATSPIVDRVSCISQILINKFLFQKVNEEDLGDFSIKLLSIVKNLNSNRHKYQNVLK